MKIKKVQYLAYSESMMYIGTFEDKKSAQIWAEKHGGYIDKHVIEKEENRIYDNLLRKETAREILKEIRGYYPVSKEYCDKGEAFILDLCKDLAKRYGVEEEE